MLLLFEEPTPPGRNPSTTGEERVSSAGVKFGTAGVDTLKRVVGQAKYQSQLWGTHGRVLPPQVGCTITASLV